MPEAGTGQSQFRDGRLSRVLALQPHLIQLRECLRADSYQLRLPSQLVSFSLHGSQLSYMPHGRLSLWASSAEALSGQKCSTTSFIRPTRRRHSQFYKTRSCAVTVHFKEENVVIEAQPRDNIVQVAARAGVIIETGCNKGSCGICEVEVRKYGTGDTEAEAGAPAVMRACIAAIPPGYSRIEIATLSDSIWGSDGWDT